jgi:ATP-dependent DNA ligase
MKKTSIYKISSKGQDLIWTIWVEGDPTNQTAPAIIHRESGVLGMKMKLESTPVTAGKNIGKANATTPYTQAVAEAEAKLEKKLRDQYVTDLKDAKKGVLRSGILTPMLAHKYDPLGKQSSSKTLEKMKIKGDIIHVQPKYDGYRAPIQVTPDEVQIYTRKGDRTGTLPHVEKELRESYERLGLTGDVPLDGELYSSEFAFDDLGGLLRRESRTPEEEEQLKKVKYYLYDTYSDKNYKERYEFLKQFASDNVIVVPSFEIEATDEKIAEKTDEFLEQGHEGLMIRTLDKGYEHKRSWSLVKCKLYEDAEFEIVDFELNKQGRLGRVICKLDKPTVDRDGKEITTFAPGLGKGISHEKGMALYNDRKNLIGKQATIEFFGRSKYGIPRHPKFKAVRQD